MEDKLEEEYLEYSKTLYKFFRKLILDEKLRTSQAGEIRDTQGIEEGNVRNEMIGLDN